MLTVRSAATLRTTPARDHASYGVDLDIAWRTDCMCLVKLSEQILDTFIRR